MLVTLSGMVMLVKEVQYSNAESPMLVTLSGMVMLVKASQERNALSPMLVTLSGMVMLVKEVQYSNALSPMLVTPSGMVTLVKAVQPENALLQMTITELGIVISSKILESNEPTSVTALPLYVAGISILERYFAWPISTAYVPSSFRKKAKPSGFSSVSLQDANTKTNAVISKRAHKIFFIFPFPFF